MSNFPTDSNKRFSQSQILQLLTKPTLDGFIWEIIQLPSMEFTKSIRPLTFLRGFLGRHILCSLVTFLFVILHLCSYINSYIPHLRSSHIAPAFETGMTQDLGSAFVASESVAVVSWVTLWTKGGCDSAASPALLSLKALLITKVNISRYVQTTFLKYMYVDIYKLHS